MNFPFGLTSLIAVAAIIYVSRAIRIVRQFGVAFVFIEKEFLDSGLACHGLHHCARKCDRASYGLVAKHNFVA